MARCPMDIKSCDLWARWPASHSVGHGSPPPPPTAEKRGASLPTVERRRRLAGRPRATRILPRNGDKLMLFGNFRAAAGAHGGSDPDLNGHQQNPPSPAPQFFFLGGGREGGAKFPSLRSKGVRECGARTPAACESPRSRLQGSRRRRGPTIGEETKIHLARDPLRQTHGRGQHITGRALTDPPRGRECA